MVWSSCSPWSWSVCCISMSRCLFKTICSRLWSVPEINEFLFWFRVLPSQSFFLLLMNIIIQNQTIKTNKLITTACHGKTSNFAAPPKIVAKRRCWRIHPEALHKHLLTRKLRHINNYTQFQSVHEVVQVSINKQLLKKLSALRWTCHYCQS